MLTGLLLGMFVSMLASSIISTSLPVIVRDVGGGQSVFGWAVTAVLLTTAIATPVWGKLADSIPRKRLIQFATLALIVTTVLAGLSQTGEMLIAFRALQGIAIAGLSTLTQVIIADVVSPRERGKYMGLFSSVLALATVGGPVLGGIITDSLGWRWTFFAMVPLALAAFAMVQITLKTTVHTPVSGRLDYVGIVLLSTCVTLLLVWASGVGSMFNWWGMETALMWGGAVLAAAALVLVEMRASNPLVPLTLFRNRTFTLSVLASIPAGVSLYGSSLYLSQYLQLARGATPSAAGLLTIPMVAGLLISSTGVGLLVTVSGKWKSYLIAGAIMLVVGTALLSTLSAQTPLELVMLYMFILGAGTGIMLQSLLVIVQNTARPSEMGAATSGVAFFRSIGGTLGVASMGGIFGQSIATALTQRALALDEALVSLSTAAPRLRHQLDGDALLNASSAPAPIAAILQDVYSSALGLAFAATLPLAVLSLIAVLLLPNVPLSRLTTTERRAQAGTGN